MKPAPTFSGPRVFFKALAGMMARPASLKLIFTSSHTLVTPSLYWQPKGKSDDDCLRSLRLHMVVVVTKSLLGF